MFAASRVGHLRFTLSGTQTPYVLIEASRTSVAGPPDTGNITYPSGSISINEKTRQVTGHNTERQDSIIGPNPALKYAGYFCARFSVPFSSWGTSSNSDGKLDGGNRKVNGKQVSGYVTFNERIRVLDVRVGVSFISEEQACSNVDNEIPDGIPLEETARKARIQWAEKLDRIQVQGGSRDEKTIFYTAVFHTLQASLSSADPIVPL